MKKQIMKKRTILRLQAAALAFLLLLLQNMTMVSHADEAENTTETANTRTLEISKASELVALAENCHDDAWSLGLTVTLTEDLSLEGSGFTGIPIFNGTFDGAGHTVSGYTYGGTGYVTGFFRYVGASGVVENLSLDVNITAAGDQECTGGIAGINEGMIRDCTVYGLISGRDTTGGIAAINQAEGFISRCGSFARIIGYYYTGGITGRNLGTVESCYNSGFVNDDTSFVTGDDELSGGLLSELQKVRNEDMIGIRTGLDTGGIAGYSAGVIRYCTNGGTVGYEHVGYNVGGIVGRQCGTVRTCVSKGKVYGKRDVGGIVGQQEPYVEQNTAESIQRSIEKIHVLAQQAAADAGDAGDTLRRDLNILANTSQQTVNAASTLTNDTRNAADAAASDFERAREEIQGVESDLAPEDGPGTPIAPSPFAVPEETPGEENPGTPVLPEIQIPENQETPDLPGTPDLPETPDLPGLPENAQDAADQAGEGAGDVAGRIQGTVEDALQQAEDAIKGSALQQAQEAIQSIDPESAAQQAQDAAGQAQEAIRDIVPESAAQQARDAVGQAQEAIQNIDPESAAQQAQDTAGQIRDAADQLTAAVQDFSLTPTLPTFTTTADTESISRDMDNLVNQLNALSAAMGVVNGDAGGSSEILQEDLTALNDQMNRTYSMVSDLVQGVQEEGVEYLFTDISEDAALISTTGRTLGCTNSGIVKADINVGGIIGTLGVDEENLETNIIKSFSLAAGERYLVSNVVYNCRNSGVVTARSDCAGGIVGYMQQGLAGGCYGYGAASSTEGSFVGGIAGKSEGTVKDCYVLCSLSGAKNIGGIAGYAGAVKNCFSMPVFTSYTGNCGAVAGQIKREASSEAPDTSKIRGNLYVNDEVYGIDDISYAGVAENITYEELLKREEVPADYSNLTVTFVADDVIVGRVEAAYGSRLADLEYPKVPKTDESYARWEDPSDRIVNGNLVVNAVYSDYIRTLESGRRFENSGKSLALVEGCFEEGDTLIAEPAEIPFEPSDQSSYTGQLLMRVTVNKKSGDAAGDLYKLRLYNPYKNARVWILEDDLWKEVDAAVKGRYLEISMTGPEQYYCVTETPNTHIRTILLVLAAVAAVAVIFFVAKKVRRVVEAPEEEMEKEEEN